MAEQDLEAIQKLLLSVRNFQQTELYKFYKETFQSLRDESRDVALESIPAGLKESVEMIECKGGYRAYKRAVEFFDELAADLENRLKEDE